MVMRSHATGRNVCSCRSLSEVLAPFETSSLKRARKREESIGPIDLSDEGLVRSEVRQAVTIPSAMKSAVDAVDGSSTGTLSANPRPLKFPTKLLIGFDDAAVKAIDDDWRRQQEDLPNRSAVVWWLSH
jgi:hypothetical protein